MKLFRTTGDVSEGPYLEEAVKHVEEGNLVLANYPIPMKLLSVTG